MHRFGSQLQDQLFLYSHSASDLCAQLPRLHEGFPGSGQLDAQSDARLRRISGIGSVTGCVCPLCPSEALASLLRQDSDSTSHGFHFHDAVTCAVAHLGPAGTDSVFTHGQNQSWPRGKAEPAAPGRALQGYQKVVTVHAALLLHWQKGWKGLLKKA